MKIRQLIEKLNNEYNFSLAEEYDNVGLLIGDYNTEIKKVLTSLDIDLEVCEEAVKNNCNVIVSHHPLFAFDPLKNIVFSDYNGKLVKYIIENNLNIIAMHTNVDNMNATVSSWIAKSLALNVNDYFGKSDDKTSGVICNVDMTYKTLIEQLKSQYGTFNYIGEEDKQISTVAIVGGSGSFLLDEFVGSDIDVFITGDLKYHDFHEMYKLNKCIIDIGHFAENVFTNNILANYNLDTVISKRKCIIKKS